MAYSNSGLLISDLMLMFTEAVKPVCWTFNNVGILELLKIVVLRVLSGQSSPQSECRFTSFSWLTVELVLLFLILRVRNRRLPRREPCAHAVALAVTLASVFSGVALRVCNGDLFNYGV